MDAPPTPEEEAARAARLLEAGLSDAPGSGPGHTPPTADEVAATFPALDILDLLGQGGMGVVYKARQRRLDRLVALKVLPRALGDDPAFAERFEREARTLARLDHPHIVRIHEFGEADGLYFLAMEYVDGASLRQVMDAGRLGPAEALGIVPQVCDALQYAHDKGVVHRDVKPENILLDESGRVKIADFGLAKLTEGDGPSPTLTGTRQVMGTWQYMAPEQYRTPQTVDHRADIFSLGVVFYEMLTGDLPVGRYQQPSEGQDLDERVDAIVMHALEREREQRYQRAAEVREDVEDLDRIPAPEPTDTPSDTPPDLPASAPPAHGHRRGRGPLILAALLLLAGSLLSLLTYAFVKYVLDQTHEDSTWSMAAVGCTIWAGGILLALLGGRHAARQEAVRSPWIYAGVIAFFHLFAIVVMLAYASNETYQWARTQVYSRSMNGPVPPPPAVTGTRSSTLRSQITLGVMRTWNRWVELARDGDLDRERAQALYATEDARRLDALTYEELETLGPAGKLGLGMTAAETLGAAPHHFHVRQIEVDPYERTAKVTARAFVGATGRTVTYGVRREQGEWKFAIVEVRVETDP